MFVRITFLSAILAVVFVSACSGYEACPEGTETCPCMQEGECDTGLECNGGICEPIPLNRCGDVDQCPEGWTCIQDNCFLVLAEQQACPRALAIDGTHLYWANNGTYDNLQNYNYNGSVTRVPLEGGESEVLASGLYRPHNMTIDDTHVYWVTCCAAESVAGRVSKEGQGEVVLEDVPAPGHLEINAGYIFWDQWVTEGQIQSSMDIMKTRKDLSEPSTTVVAEAGTGSWAVDSQFLYWKTGDFSTGERLMKMPHQGGDAVELSEVEGGIYKLLSDGVSVFWMESFTNDKIRMVPCDGGRTVNLYYPGPTGGHILSNLAPRNDHVFYFVGLGENTFVLSKSPVDPADPITFFEMSDDYPGEMSLAVDDEYAYFAFCGGKHDSKGMVLKYQLQ